MSKRMIGVSFTEKVKKIAYVIAESERDAEKQFLDGNANIVDMYIEDDVEMDVHDVFPVSD